MTTTIADMEESQLEQHLRDGGVLVASTDVLGRPQPAPTFQAFELDVTDTPPRERVVMVRTVGGISNTSTRTIHKQVNMVVAVVGQTSQEDRIVVNALANDMELYLMSNITDGKNIFNITSSGVSGSFILDDSRRVFEINILVSFNICQPVF